MGVTSQKRIRVLHVDDEPDLTDLTQTFLEREDDRFTVETATSADEGLTAIDDGPPDCVVSDYNMPDTDGLEFLQAVRAEYPDLPFILFTGKGSEAVASDAISAGVTDYLQKESGTSHYTILANRISNAVEATRSAATSEQRRRRLEQILKTAPGCVIQADADGQFIFANERAEEVLGLETDEVTQLAYNDPEWEIRAVNGEPIPNEELPFRQVCDTGDPIYDAKHTIRWPDGSRRILSINAAPLFDETGAVESVVGSLTDITDYKRHKQEILTLKSQYQTLVENVPNGAVFLFDADLRYVRARGTELGVVGISPDDIEGATPHDVFPEETADELVHYFTDALNGNSHEFTQTLGGDTYRNRTAPVQTDDGEITHGMALAQNVTDQTERRREVERQNERLEEFTSVISHDLRNPLTVAEGSLELARETCESDSLARAADAIDRSQALIDDLLTLAREGDDVDATESVALTDVARDSWQSAETAQATLEAETLRAAEADRSRLRQLFENLYRNAVEHGGDAVSVSVGQRDDGFYVADTGPGIPESDREAVFEAGYSTATSGTGFGLRIVERVVEAHEWDITVTESEQGGARFEVTGVEFTDQ